MTPRPFSSFGVSRYADPPFLSPFREGEGVKRCGGPREGGPFPSREDHRRRRRPPPSQGAFMKPPFVFTLGVGELLPNLRVIFFVFSFSS